MDQKKIDPNSVRLSRRTFNPNSPVYTTPSRRAVISDITPMGSSKVKQQPIANQTQPSSMVSDIRPKTTNILDQDLDNIFKKPLPEHKASHHPRENHRPSKKKVYIALSIFISDLILLGYSFLNKARYHHAYIVILIVNCVIAFCLPSGYKFFKWSYLSYQFLLILVSIGIATLFTYNFINTNKIYYSNYQEIKYKSASMSFQQKQNLATYQDTVVFNRNQYMTQDKIFYSLIGLQVTQSITASTLLLRRK